MPADIIARGMAAHAAKLAQEALDELSKVVEGTINEELTEFTDLEGHVVAPDENTLYLDVENNVYYRWNAEEQKYYATTGADETVKYTPQDLDVAQKQQARDNISASMCRTGLRTLKQNEWNNNELLLEINLLTVNDYVHIVGSSSADEALIAEHGLGYRLQNGGILFSAESAPSEDINLQIAIISGMPL